MYNQITIIGNLGRDPEMRYMQDGTAVASFSVAVTRKAKDSETTTWYKIECWRKLAELAYQYLKKGRQVLIVADRIEAEAWIDRASGEARGQLKVTATEIKFLGGRDGDPNTSGLAVRDTVTEEDLPF